MEGESKGPLAVDWAALIGMSLVIVAFAGAAILMLK